MARFSEALFLEEILDAEEEALLYQISEYEAWEEENGGGDRMNVGT